MAYADELLALSTELANHDNAGQAHFRRAVSTAYYALFHLLVSDATLNWNVVEFRPKLARFFEHGNMKSVSLRFVSDLKRKFSETIEPQASLYIVADTFVQAQEERELADYDVAQEWTQTEVLDRIQAVRFAFGRWRTIREQPLAQGYLIALLGKKR